MQTIERAGRKKSRKANSKNGNIPIMSKLAVFDLDGTLYDGNIIAGFLVHHRQHQVNRLQLYSYFASHSLLIPLWKIG